MSLLLKALKQAESANTNKSGAGRSEPRKPHEGDLELEPVSADDAQTDPAQAREWVEPPDLLFDSSGVVPKAAPRRSRAFRWPQLSLVPFTAALAAVIALGYGIYLYFALQPPAPVELPAATVAAPAPLEPAPVAAVTVVPVAPALPAPPAQTAAVEPAPTIPQAAPEPRTPAESAVSPATRSAPRTSGASTPTASPAFRPDVQSTVLNQAYAAYQRGALSEAQRLYTQANAGGNNVDALLGLATVASLQNREADAQQLYRKVLAVDPRNATAQGALLDLLGNTDGQATESRLKALIERDPSPHLHQTLGNLYAGQGRWNDAQAAYFEAWRGAPGNADYAFNLAVSLDQLHQAAAALTYYEKALATPGAHRFDRAEAEARVQQLKPVR
ncbi:hypothetical protein [Thiobacillus sp.]|uniref:tetratricopeptide repeat protein n=1 Tax=Thiobacillus sp. TaxID=924 RepID=UPI0026010CE1|nr:hypothetical protein [Thiobacillus sp.]MBT9539585.1 hypothetical protein [Thiobacillus sp.]